MSDITQSAAWLRGTVAAKEQMAAVEHRHCAANKCWLNVTDGEEYCHRHKPVNLSAKGPS